MDFTLHPYQISTLRAFISGLPNAICRTDLALKPKNHPTSGLVKAWYCKKNFNTATIPLQICNGTVAVLQNQIIIFYFLFSPIYMPLSLSSHCLIFFLFPEHS